MKKFKKLSVIMTFLAASSTLGAITATAKVIQPTIGSQKAKEIALAHAKLKASDVVFKKIQLDTDDDVKHYELEFYHNKVKYEYDIKATNGVILDIEKDDKKIQISANTTKPTSSTSTIGAQKAKEIAAAHAKLKVADVVFKKVELDTDDGINHYEIEFYHNNVKYEYDIKAVDGTILDAEKDDKKIQISTSTTKPTPSTTTIGAQKAKDIALTHAKLNGSNAVFKKVELDTDDGVKVYELEFQKGDTEYEYKIHALTGTILDFEIDRD